MIVDERDYATRWTFEMCWRDAEGRDHAEVQTHSQARTAAEAHRQAAARRWPAGTVKPWVSPLWEERRPRVAGRATGRWTRHHQVTPAPTQGVFDWGQTTTETDPQNRAQPSERSAPIPTSSEGANVRHAAR